MLQTLVIKAISEVRRKATTIL